MISDFSFGRIVVNGRTCTTDIKVIQGTLTSDWWRKSGHTVEIEDVQDILNAELDILVIGKGQPGYMKIADSLKQRLSELNIKLIEAPTARAVETFNRLYKEGRRVAGGFHFGC
jgi:hypothetical protein